MMVNIRSYIIPPTESPFAPVFSISLRWVDAAFSLSGNNGFGFFYRSTDGFKADGGWEKSAACDRVLDDGGILLRDGERFYPGRPLSTRVANFSRAFSLANESFFASGRELVVAGRGAGSRTDAPDQRGGCRDIGGDVAKSSPLKRPKVSKPK